MCKEDITLLWMAVEQFDHVRMAKIGLKAIVVNLVMAGCSVYSWLAPSEETIPTPAWLHVAHEGNLKCEYHLAQAYRASRGIASVTIMLLMGMAHWKSRVTEGEFKRFSKVLNLYSRFTASLQRQ